MTAAINLALSGVLTDAIPDCMSLTSGSWVHAVQDYMPAALAAGKHLEPWSMFGPPALLAALRRGYRFQR